MTINFSTDESNATAVSNKGRGQTSFIQDASGESSRTEWNDNSFFQHSWHVIKTDVVELVNNFFGHMRLGPKAKFN